MYFAFKYDIVLVIASVKTMIIMQLKSFVDHSFYCPAFSITIFLKLFNAYSREI